MKSNDELTKDVQDAIHWEPTLHAAKIGVNAEGGIITLTGTVDSYLKKTRAEDTAKNVIGVKAVVEKLDVTYRDEHEITDDEIAQEVLNALKTDLEVPDELVKVQVENGWVTLTGELPWNYQKQAAQIVIRHLPGVKVLSNDISIQPEADNELEKAAIEVAFRRSASIDEANIHVSVLGNNVRLTGVVKSYSQRDDAERMAWNAPGVQAVDNEIAIDFNE